MADYCESAWLELQLQVTKNVQVISQLTIVRQNKRTYFHTHLRLTYEASL